MAVSTEATILVVDDDPGIRNLLKRDLSNRGHDVVTAQDSAEAVALISTVQPDLLLVDVGLPDIDGAALCRSLKEGHDTRDIPVILMSASADLGALRQDSGADAILRKPFNRDELHLWARSLILARWATRSLEHAEAVLIQIAGAVEVRSQHSKGHIWRIADLSTRLAAAVGLDANVVKIIWKAALLHDVGLIGVPEAILRKPGPLTPEEYEEVKRHTILGADLCRLLPRGEAISAIVRSHHERWDGQGYPDSLAGETIPLGARIIALADAFGAGTADRPYRAALSVGDTLDLLRLGGGTQWDSHLLVFFDPIARSAHGWPAGEVPRDQEDKMAVA